MPKTPQNPHSETSPKQFLGDGTMSNTAKDFPLTHNAKTRRQQRAVSGGAIDLVCQFGRSFPAGDCCRRNILMIKDAARLLGDGASVSIVEDTAHYTLEVVVHRVLGDVQA